MALRSLKYRNLAYYKKALITNAQRIPP